MENWRGIPPFPGYSVSDTGLVRNDDTGRLMTRLLNQNGNMHVGLTRGKRQHRRSVAVLVAEAFLAKPELNVFDTVIHLDGDTKNNHVTNLMYRPRWFAVRYALQFKEPRRGIYEPIEDVSTYEQFSDTWAAAITCGLLEREIVHSILNNVYVWPTFQTFRVRIA